MNSQKLTPGQQSRIRQALEQVPFAQLLGIELESFEPGSAVLALNLREELRQNNGVIHGGAIASLIDTATALAILTVIPDSEKVTTVDLTISYLRPLITGRARAHAKVLRAGRRIIAVSADVASDSGTLAVTALSTYMRLGN
jgi:uncharacterized protein (TIGR00369 family)